MEPISIMRVDSSIKPPVRIVPTLLGIFDTTSANSCLILPKISVVKLIPDVLRSESFSVVRTLPV